MSTPNSAAEPRLVGHDGATIADDGVTALDFTEAAATLAERNGTLSSATASLLERIAVRINPGEDVRALLPYTDHISRFDVAFPGYRDGRGYSTARILRESGFTGPVRAVGDVLRDQVLLMMRCGFDQFLLRDAHPAEAMRRAAAKFSTVYQSAADSAIPAWELRRRGSA